MSWECRFGFRPRDLRLRPTCCGLGNRFQSHQTRSSQPLGWAGAGCLAFRRDLACFPPLNYFLESSICPISQASNPLPRFCYRMVLCLATYPDNVTCCLAMRHAQFDAAGQGVRGEETPEITPYLGCIRTASGEPTSAAAARSSASLLLGLAWPSMHRIPASQRAAVHLPAA